MRHDPAEAAIVIMLRSLKMYGMAQAASELIEHWAPAFEAAILHPLSVALGKNLRRRRGSAYAYTEPFKGCR